MTRHDCTPNPRGAAHTRNEALDERKARAPDWLAGASARIPARGAERGPDIRDIPAVQVAE